MELGNIRLRRISIILLSFFSFTIYSQIDVTTRCDTMLHSVFNNELEQMETKQMLTDELPIILISNLNCSSCVNYFVKHQDKYRFLFLTNSLSLLEVNTIIKSRQIQKERCYFMLSRNTKNTIEIIENKPTPCMISSKNQQKYFYDYELLSKLTREFTVNHRQFLKKL